MLANKLMSALSGGTEDKLYVDDVFSAYTYTGNGSTHTINNGIDLAGEGGLVWTKWRSNIYGAAGHTLTDTITGLTKSLSTNTSDGHDTNTTLITSVSSTGYSVGSSALVNGYNTGAPNYVSWTFRKAPKFFDVVTWTGNDLNPRVMNHSLGASPGMMIVKTTSGVGSSNWNVYHRSLASPKQTLLTLNTGDAASNQGFDYWIDQNESSFIPSSGNNFSGRTYVAYLFAHDTSADGIIQCGTYTGNGSATGPIVNLGWEPQYLMIKNASGTGNWQIIDSMRGMPVGSADATLQANLANAESSVDYISPTATGFQITSTSSEVNTPGSNYIYLAIRRPNKPPTTGTEVYNAIARTATNAAATVTGVGFAPDLVHSFTRTAELQHMLFDRLRGATNKLYTSALEAESSDAPSLIGFDSMDGVRLGPDNAYGGINYAAIVYINHFFRRAPGFFDVVCYAGTGVAGTVPHNLAAMPELVVIKMRNSLSGWYVWSKNDGVTPKSLLLNSSAMAAAVDAMVYVSANMSPVNIGLSSYSAGGNTNSSGITYVAYLFATLPGISKVGSYTGNGTTQTINCGFTTGARFILIKRTDSAGDWYVWDTARGIVAGNDPHLSLNTTAGEVTTDDSVDPDVSGFIVNQVAATNINVSGGQYIFLAIA